VYVDSPIVERRGAGDPLVGRFAPDAMVSVSGRPTRLRTLLGGQFTCLLLDTDPGRAERFAARALAGTGAIPVRLHAVLPAGTATGGRALPAPVVHDEGRDLRAEYGAERPTWFLVRPDGHVAAAGDAEDAAGFRGALGRCSRARPAPDEDTDGDLRPLPVEAAGTHR
jgi:3-(3-hydroxy-phenyl)propionate hydroxylase